MARVETEKDGRKRRKWLPSLRISLMALVLSCWVIPILLIGGFSSYYATRDIYDRVSDIAATSVQNNADTIRRTLEQVVSDSLTISYSSAVRDAYTKYLGDRDVVSLYSTVTNYLDDKYSRSLFYNGTMLMFTQLDGEINSAYYTYNRTTATMETISYYQRFYRSEAAAEARVLAAGLDTAIGFMVVDGRLLLVRNLSLVNNRFAPYCVMVMDINMQILDEDMRNLTWLTDSSLHLNGISIHIAGDDAPALEDYPPVNANGKPVTRLLGNSLYISGRSLSNRFSLEYYVRADLTPLLEETGTNRNIVLLLTLLAIPMMGFVFFFFLRKVTRPVTLLGDVSQLIEEGDFGVQMDTTQLGSAEFKYLGDRLNSMSARLESQFERLYREELALRDARIKALQSQINPHFLGNTLEIISWEARLAGNTKVNNMMEALSTMLDAALDRRRKPLVHLSEEMMYVNAYLYIIGERWGKRLEVRQEIDQNLLSWYVPRLILQPIVENAVEHGVSARQRGVIVIRAIQVDDEWMRLEVENSSPLSAEDEARIERLLADDVDESEESAGNIGIRNVHQRLRILYGPKAGLSIKSDKNGSTVSSLCIHHSQPAQEKTI